MSTTDSKQYTLEEATKLFRTRKTRFVVFRIKDLNVYPDVVSKRNDTRKELLNELEDNKPAFIYYDYEELTKDGRYTDKMYCIYWKPENVSQTDRIIYSQALHKFRTSQSGFENVDCEDEDELKSLLKNEQPDPKRLSAE